MSHLRHILTSGLLAGALACGNAAPTGTGHVKASVVAVSTKDTAGLASLLCGQVTIIGEQGQKLNINTCSDDPSQGTAFLACQSGREGGNYITAFLNRVGNIPDGQWLAGGSLPLVTTVPFNCIESDDTNVQVRFAVNLIQEAPIGGVDVTVGITGRLAYEVDKNDCKVGFGQLGIIGTEQGYLGYNIGRPSKQLFDERGAPAGIQTLAFADVKPLFYNTDLISNQFMVSDTLNLTTWKSELLLKNDFIGDDFRLDQMEVQLHAGDVASAQKELSGVMTDIPRETSVYAATVGVRGATFTKDNISACNDLKKSEYSAGLVKYRRDTENLDAIIGTSLVRRTDLDGNSIILATQAKFLHAFEKDQNGWAELIDEADVTDQFDYFVMCNLNALAGIGYRTNVESNETIVTLYTAGIDQREKLAFTSELNPSIDRIQTCLRLGGIK